MGLAVFREHVLSLFRQRIKNVNITSLASVRKLNSMIFNTWLNPLNRQAGLVIPALPLSPLSVVVNFSKGNLLNPLCLLAKAMLCGPVFSPCWNIASMSCFIELFLDVIVLFFSFVERGENHR